MNRDERIVLGIIDSKPAAAAVLKGSQVLAALAEERLCRHKLASGVPRQAIQRVMDIAGIAPAAVEAIAVAQNYSVYLPEPIPWSGWFNDVERFKSAHFDRLSGQLAALVGNFPIAWKAHHKLKQIRSRERRQKLPRLLQTAYGLNAPISFFDHHFCHATSAYYASQFNDALVVTLDGGGDGLSGSVYLANSGRLQRLTSIDSYNSLGNFYSYVTELCGFRAEKHEGKITGLAAYGKPRYIEILREFIGYRHPGQICYWVPMYHHSALSRLSQRLPANFDKADLAASVQQLLEEIGLAFIQYWLRHTNCNHIAVAGGVFANVKFNQRIFELPEVEEIVVYPAMDDSGLCVGSALALLTEQQPLAVEQREPLCDVYWGTAYDDTAIRAALSDRGLQAIPVNDIHDTVAALLADGKVVARFTGRMEFGPRALGHRSILYQTTDPSVNDWLNQRLQRTEFMPFAPATLAEYAADCYHNVEGAELAAAFMTITFACTETMKAQSPGVVHLDGTARPQLVNRHRAPDFYAILQAYHARTGIPSLINTSFNRHGEPIVESPETAIHSFLSSQLDYLAIGRHLIAHPEPTPRPLAPSSRATRFA